MFDRDSILAVDTSLACGRVGFNTAIEGTLTLEQNEDVTLTPDAKKKLSVQGAPIQSMPFTVRR